MLDKNEIEKELDKLIQIRENFYKYLDNSIPKNENGSYNFENIKLNSKDVYENFFKLDYQARKLRGMLVETYNLKAK